MPNLRIRIPQDSDAPDVRIVRRLAARVGRTLGDQAKHDVARRRLRDFLNTLDPGRVRYWKSCPMIDGRWDGATGHGGFWATGTDAINSLARDILLSREYRVMHGLPELFQVVSSREQL